MGLFDVRKSLLLVFTDQDLDVFSVFIIHNELVASRRVKGLVTGIRFQEEIIRLSGDNAITSSRLDAQHHSGISGLQPPHCRCVWLCHRESHHQLRIAVQIQVSTSRRLERVGNHNP